MNLPEMKKVNSSSIDKIGYDAEQQELYIHFKRSGLYVYRNVPEIEFTSLMDASSHGKYLNMHIKNLYQHEKI